MIRFIKVGGSLFDFDDTPFAILEWLKRQPAATNVLVAGGGIYVDHVRRLQKELHANESLAHWTAIELMSVTSTVLKRWFPQFCFIHSIKELPLFNEFSTEVMANNYLLDPLRDISEDSQLPESWNVTSDSLVAELAIRMESPSQPVELVLLKSTEGTTSGVVDDYFFAKFENSLPVRIVNLREFLRPDCD